MTGHLIYYLEFTGKIFYWRGPAAPYYYVAVPAEQSSDIKAVSNLVTYGWGVIPVYNKKRRALMCPPFRFQKA
jgi:hypothetical protein